MLAAAPIALVALPSILEAAPVDPVDAAYAELVEASHAVDRSGRDGLGESLLVWVRGVVALHARLRADYGAERGRRIWTAAMDRHHDWYCDLHGLERTRYA